MSDNKWAAMVPDPHPAANCGPLQFVLPPGHQCPTCGYRVPTSPLDDRRQRAREAYWDALGGLRPEVREGVSVCIDVATQVKITEDMVTTMLHEVDRIGVQHGGIEAGLAAAFRAAGFEVVQ